MPLRTSTAATRIHNDINFFLLLDYVLVIKSQNGIGQGVAEEELERVPTFQYPTLSLCSSTSLEAILLLRFGGYDQTRRRVTRGGEEASEISRTLRFHNLFKFVSIFF
jgi:hypothetical protein